MSEFLEGGRVVKFVISIRIKDYFLKLEDIIEFVKFRLNLKYCCSLDEILVCDDSSNPCTPTRKGELLDEISNAT